ncbi:2056_t:CDS:2, partial [Gigaspora margarita]
SIVDESTNISTESHIIIYVKYLINENALPLGKDGKPIPINLDKARLGITVWPEV